MRTEWFHVLTMGIVAFLLAGCATPSGKIPALDPTVPVVEYAGEWQGRTGNGKKVIVGIQISNGEPAIISYRELASHMMVPPGVGVVDSINTLVNRVEWNGFFSVEVEDIGWNLSTRTLVIRNGRRTLGVPEPRWHSTLTLQFLNAADARLSLDRWADPVPLRKVQ